MRYLFIAPAAYAWGELTLGLRIAEELRDRGHRIFFLAARKQLDRVRSFDCAGLREKDQRMEQAILRIVERKKIDAILLVDATTWLWALRTEPVRPRFLESLGIPIFAIDVWGVRERGFAWDLGTELLRPDLEAIETCRMLQPAPFLRPRRSSYRALPMLSPITRKDRQRSRAELGISAREKLVIFPSASWQSDHPGQRVHSIRAARYLPLLIAAYVMRAGVRLIHVGPAEHPSLARAMGDRYTFAGQVTPPELERWMRAADLMLSFNLAATTIGTAIALHLPVLAGINSLRADRVKQALARLPGPPSKVMSRWLEKTVPIERFSVWPIGFHRLMQRALESNPLASALRMTEVLDEEGFVEEIAEIGSNRGLRGEIRDAQAAYAKLVTVLPRAADMLGAT